MLRMADEEYARGCWATELKEEMNKIGLAFVWTKQ